MMECLAHPLLLFLSVWGVTLALYLGGVLAGTFPSPHALTVGTLSLNLVTFPLGYLTWTLFKDLIPLDLDRDPKRDTSRLGTHTPRPDAKLLTPRRMQRALNITLVLGVIALLLMLYRIALIAGYSHIDFWELVQKPRVLRFHLVRYIESGASKTSLMTMLLSLTSGLFAIGFVFLGVFLRLDETIRKYAYLLGFLLVALTTCLLNLSRYDMTVSILYLILAYCVTSLSVHREQRRRLTRDLLLPMAAVVIIFIAVELLLRKSGSYGEAGSWRGVLFSFYWYLASPIAAFNDFLGSFQGDYGLGQKTFFPFYKWLYRLDLVPQPNISNYGEFVHIPYPANVYTYLRNFYEDFGLLGVALVPYALGWLTAAIKDRARRSFPFLNLYVFLLVPIFFSFYSYPLLSSQFYLQILFGFVFFRYELSHEHGPLYQR